MFTWLALALAATANLGLFVFTVIYFFKQRQALLPQTSNPQPQVLPPIQTSNPNTEWPKQLPPVILQQLQDMISQRQLVNVNHNQLALH